MKKSKTVPRSLLIFWVGYSFAYIGLAMSPELTAKLTVTGAVLACLVYLILIVAWCYLTDFVVWLFRKLRKSA